MGRVVTGQMSPTNLASGEAGDGARRGRRPKTRMAVFLAPEWPWCPFGCDGPKIPGVDPTFTLLRCHEDSLQHQGALVIVPAWPAPRGRRGIRRARPARAAPPRRGRRARRPAPPGCAGSGARRSPVDAGKLLGTPQRQDPPPALLRPRPTRPDAGAPPPCGTSSSASSGSSASPSAQARSAAPESPSIWCARAIRANSFRVIESLGAEPARLRRRYSSAPRQSCRSMAIAPRLNRTNGSSGRSSSSSRRIRLSRSSFRARRARST